jgi:phage/plasmid-like protein (TIGR03299 family)
MAHEITQRADKSYEFAYTGEPAWHNLGSELPAGASIDTWKKEAGLDWEVFESAATFQSIKGTHVFPDKRVLFRSDNHEPLSIVSSDYHVVQPGEVLEFFRDITEIHGYKLSAAGSLFGGKRFWATAEVGKSLNAVDDDKIDGQLLLVTSVDGTLATQAKFVSTRVVCNNTLTIAMGESGKRSVRKTHASSWDAKEFKLDLGLIDAGWDKFSENIKKLTEYKVTDGFARSYFQNKFYDHEKMADEQGIGAIKRVNTLMELYQSGTGAEYSRGTAYGILNAATELYTHGLTNRDKSHQFWNSYFGKDEAVKNEIYSELLGMLA